MAGLQFSDTSGKQGLLQECEFLLNLGDGTITGDVSSAALPKVFTRLINEWLHKIVTMIFQSQDEWEWDDINQTDYPIATTSLVAAQQDYTLPATLSMLKIKRVETSFDNGASWQKAEPFNVSESGVATDTTSVASNFSPSKPYYDIEFNAVRLYPIPTANSTGGLKIWYYRNALEFVSSDTTKVPPIDAPFHKMLAVGAAFEYAQAKNMPNKDYLAEVLADYEARLKQFYGSKQEDRHIVIKAGYGDKDFS